MSEFSVPALAVGYDGRWVHVPLSGDLEEWARKAAADYATAHGGNKRQIRALLEGAGGIARNAADSVIALVLIPVADEGIRALVRFCPVDMSAVESAPGSAIGEDDDSWSALIGDLTPDNPWEESAEITEMTTKAGPCRRIIRRLTEGEGDTRAITEHVAYAWLFPQYAAGILMMTSFIGLGEARRWRSALDELAAAVELEPEPAS
jgi:hypothetical protein